MLSILEILEDTTVDGPGFRTAIYAAGCPNGCPGCHNPQTHDFEGGQDIELDTLLKDMCRNPFIKGVTFSGGEPFCKAEPLYYLAVELKRKGKHLMAYSGYTFEQREDYQRMRPYLMTGQYDILIIKDLSRFSRRNSRGLVELEDLRDAGVRIVAIGDSIDYPTHDDWTNIRLRFLLNEMPVTDSSQKVKSVISRRQQDGRWICSVPYGYVMKTR